MVVRRRQRFGRLEGGYSYFLDYTRRSDIYNFRGFGSSILRSMNHSYCILHAKQSMGLCQLIQSHG